MQTEKHLEEKIAKIRRQKHENQSYDCVAHIQDTVYAHDFNNPIRPDNGCDRDIIVSPSVGRISLQKDGLTKHQTKYKLRVIDPRKLGLKSFSNQSARKEFIRTALSACNLLLKHATLSDHEVIFSETTFDDSVPPRVDGNTVTITLNNLSVELFTSSKGSENLSEEELISVMNMLNVLNGADNDRKIHNMKKSLDKFDEAMGTDVNRLSIFSRLCNSLEIASCYDSDVIIRDWTNKVTEVIGPALRIDRDTIITYDVIDDWRRFYNRTKHPDDNETKVSSFLDGKENTTLKIGALRQVTRMVILDRLKSI